MDKQHQRTSGQVHKVFAFVTLGAGMFVGGILTVGGIASILSMETWTGLVFGTFPQHWLRCVNYLLFLLQATGGRRVELKVFKLLIQ